MEQLERCMLADQFWLRNKYYQIIKRNDKDKEEQLKRWQEKVNASILACENRQANVPTITYPDLPITQEKDNILKIIQENQVIIVAGETGSGKTTQLPKICLEAGLGRKGFIGHTQPRRIAARTVASRIAAEFESPLGKYIGYKVRFSDRTNPENYIKIMTDGILLSETQESKWLSQYDCLIIDEAHERSLNIDFILGYLKKLIQKRKDLKLIITSATIDVERFSTFFNNAPMIEIKGRSYPVEVLYLGKDFQDESDDPIQQVANAVKLACHKGPGDILIFQSGEKEIRDVIEVLSRAHLSQVELLPLFSRQSNAEQQKVFQRSSKRKIIVTTNVAETSLTVPNIRFVIDSGLARISRYNYRNKLQRLPIEAISQASADQRKGRCGRVGPGICYRLFSLDDYQTRPLYTEPEILRTNLAGVILKMLALNFESIETFPFIEAPDSRYIKDGFTLLERLQAVDENKKITPLGKVLANIPIEPKLGRVIIAANQYGALKEILIIVSALSIVDVRERPQGNQEEADSQHAKFLHETSDFMSYLNLWEFIISHKAELSHQKMRKLCQQNFLSFLRILEWIDVHEQLTQIAHELSFRQNQQPADYALIHKALLCGFLDGIGVKDEKKEYTGARNVKFFIHPQSVAFKKSPSWLVASEIVHTTKTYARVNAQIETTWIEEVAKDLLKKQYDEPHFDPKSGRVVALERATLFGLEIYAKKKINYEKVAPIEARKIFIEQALVQEQMVSKFGFYLKNKATRAALESLEDRIRKQLILVDESKIHEFYIKHLPFYVCSVPALDKYLQDKIQDCLVFNQNDILLNEIPDDLIEQYPESLTIKDQFFNLSYCFDLSAEDDGVTLIIPFEMVQYVKDQDFSWLIPGLLAQKIDFLIRALPKKSRTTFVPIPDFVKKALSSISANSGNLSKVLQQFLEKECGYQLGKVWENLNYPPCLVMHFKVISKEGKLITQSDDLQKIYQSLQEQYLEIYSSEQPIEQDSLTQWQFADLPKEYTVKRAKLDFVTFPALVDMHQSVSIKLFDVPEMARVYHHQGLARLYLLTLTDTCKNARRSISAQTKKLLSKAYQPFGEIESLIDDILMACSLHLFVQGNDIRTKADFNKILALHRQELMLLFSQTLNMLTQSLSTYHDILMQMQKLKVNILDGEAHKDILNQLEGLFSKHFARKTPLIWLKRYPIYLKALQGRLEKLPRQPEKDKQARLEVQAIQKAYIGKLNTKDKSLLTPQDPLMSFQWKIEELRVSLFAQDLKTIEPVSKIRLQKALDNLN